MCDAYTWFKATFPQLSVLASPSPEIAVGALLKIRDLRTFHIIGIGEMRCSHRLKGINNNR
jgi:hypothetical protein